MVVLATKLYVSGDARDRSLQSLRSMIDNDLGELDVAVSISIRDDGFPEVDLDGSDETIAANLLREEWGEISETFEEGQEYVGTLDSWDETAITLDAGREIRINRDDLGLGQGDPESIRTRFGLIQHMPLRFVYDEPPRLADDQIDQLYDWRRGNGRVNVNSATRAEVRATVNRAGHAQDIVTVERLGLLEQSIICAEGTDPPGLLAGIGEYLPSELLCVINA